jgi:eukaryotic-like serine/threonine-protein kinase
MNAKHLIGILLLFVVYSLLYSQENFISQRWRFQTEGPIRGSCLWDDHALYFGSSDASFYSVKKADGSLLWKFTTRGALTGKPEFYENLVILSSRDNFVYGLEKKTGKEVWKFAMKPVLPHSWHWEYYTAAPVVFEHKVLVASGDGNLYCLDAKTGKLLWRYQTTRRLRATPVVHNGLIYQPGYDGVLHVLRASDGNVLWKFETDGANYQSDKFGYDRNSIDSTPAIKDSLLVFGSRDGNTYCININTRKLKWKFSYGPTWAMSGAEFSDDLVYIGWSDNSLLSAIDFQTGKERWKYKAGSLVYSTPAISNNLLVVGSADHKVYGLNKQTGEKLWEYETRGSVFSSPVLDSEAIYIGSDDGGVYALEPSQKTFRAVYHPEPKSKLEESLYMSNQKITPYLEKKGFEKLDSTALLKFLHDRVQDKAPSVIVFTFQFIPQSAIGENPATGLIRSYLETGGKIVWPGAFPNMYKFDERGRPVAVDGTLASSLLGVTFTNVNESGNYYARSTQEGRNWGLPIWFTHTNSMVSAEGLTVLAYDEYNRPTVWLKRFSSEPRSGFLACRPWGWYAPLEEEGLSIIYNLAVYGL